MALRRRISHNLEDLDAKQAACRHEWNGQTGTIRNRGPYVCCSLCAKVKWLG